MCVIPLPQKTTETIKKEEPAKKEEMKIEDLPGVGPKTAERLREAGIAVIEEVAVAIPEDLMEIGVTHDQAKKIIDSARSQINKFGIIFKTAKDILKEMGPSQYLTSGVPSLDRILGGGFETKKISEIWGSFGSGKTQLALQLAVTAQLPTAKGGLNAPSLVIDTEGTFHHSRVVSIAKRFELDPEKVLGNIVLCQAYNSDHQVTLLNHANEVIKERGIHLIIIDSLTAHFRSEYIGREMLASRQQELNRHRNRLLKLCRIEAVRKFLHIDIFMYR